MDKTSLKHRTLSNTYYHFMGYILPIFFLVFITPIMVSRLGVKDYGLMVFIASIMGVLGLLDFGIGASTSKNLAQYMGREGSEESVKKLMRTSRSIFLVIGILGFVLASILAVTIFFFFHDKVSESPEFYLLMALSAFTFLVASMNNINMLVPNAVERFDIGIKLGMGNLIIGSITNLVIVLMGGRLVALFIAQAIIALVFLFLAKHFAKKLIGFDYSGYEIDKTELKKGISWSIYSSINELARTSLFSLDRLLIPVFLGTSSLAYYTLPGNITARIPGVSDNLSGVIFPVSSRLHGNNDMEVLRRVYERSSRLILLVSFAITMGIATNGYQILRYWLSEDIANNSYPVIVILAATNFILSMMSPVATFLMTSDRWRFYTSISTSMAVINIVAILILLPKFGIQGAAFAYLISTLPILYAIHQLEKRFLGLDGFWKKWTIVVLKFLSAGAIFYLVNAYLIRPFIHDFTSLAILGPGSVLVCLFIYFILGFMHKDDVKDITQWIFRR